MEPEGATPVIEYVLAGEDAERICARGFVALAAAARLGEHQNDLGSETNPIEIWTTGDLTWRLTTRRHFAYPAVEIERPAATQGADPVRTVCAYGGGLSALNFAAAWGFTPDQMHVASGRWETPK